MSFRIRFLLLGFIGLLATGCSSGSPKSNLSLEEASQLVIDQVIQPDQLDFDLIAFAWPELLQAGDVVAPYNYHGEDPAPSETTLEGEAWFFWLDDLPGAHFTHENRFVFVDQATGEITTLDQEWWPTLNGKGLWLDKASYNNPDNWIYATVELQEDANTFWNPPTGKMALAAVLSPPAQTGESPGHALVINASTLDERGSDDFNTDVRLMTDALQDEGFKTTYLGPEGDTNPDRAGVPFSDSDRASGQPWRAWLRERAPQVQPGETLVVYLTGHGDYDEGVSSVGGEKHRIFDFNLRQELSKFNPGVHIVVIVESCEAGGYTDALKDIADVTLTASDHDSASWGDNDFVLSWINPLFLTDLNPLDEGSEYTSSLLEGWKNLSSDPDEIAQVQALAEERGVGFWPLFFAEAYDDASEYDLPARLGISDPMTVFGSEKTRAKVVTTGATGDVQSCTPGGTTPETVPARQDVGSLSAEWIEQNNQHVLHFEAEFPDAETIDQPIWGGLEFFDPSRPVSDEHGDYVFAGMGNIQFGFFAGEGVSTPNFNYVDSDGSWQTESNPGYSVSAEDNRILVDVPSHLVPPGGTYFFYTDDGSNCDSVGLEPDGPVGAIPPGGPIVIFDLTVGSDEPAVATFNDFSGDAKFCQTDSFVEDLGVDIDRVEFEYDPTVPGGWVRVDVITGDPGPASLDNFSFATIIDLTLGVESQKTFVFNHHDEITDAGELDPDSGNLIESNAQIDISEDVSLGKPGTMVSFEIPFLDFPSQVDGVRVFTYRTLMEGDSKLCDDVIILIQPVIVQDPAAMDE